MAMSTKKNSSSSDIPTHRKATQVIAFGSGQKVPYNTLSNFNRAYITLFPHMVTDAMLEVNPQFATWFPKGEREPPAIFATSEHLWQALKAKTFEAMLDFTIKGRVGTLTMASMLYFAPRVLSAAGRQKWAESKVVWWAKKGNVGITAKMAGNSKYASALGWKDGVDMEYSREHLASALEKQVWLDILYLKFTQNTSHKATLIETGPTSYLLELARGAARGPADDNMLITPVEHWGGYIQPHTNALFGENAMGKYLMHTRVRLFKEMFPAHWPEKEDDGSVVCINH